MTEQLTHPDDYWNHPASDLLTALQSTAGGLNPSEARRRLKDVGPNVLQVRKRSSAWGLLLSQFKSPLVLILLFAAAVSAFVQEWTDAVVILTIVLGSALITFAQEYTATNAVEKLRARLVHKVMVAREGQPQAIPAEEVVPGDVDRERTR